jgi:hypothetical protein
MLDILFACIVFVGIVYAIIFLRKGLEAIEGYRYVRDKKKRALEEEKDNVP